MGLGARIDAEQAARKGRMMAQILERHLARQQQQPEQLGEQPVGSPASSPPTVTAPLPARATSGCPFGRTKPAAAAQPAAAEQAAPAEGSLEAARRQLYSWQVVPPAFRDLVAAEVAQQAQALSLPPRPTLPSAGPADPLAGAPLCFLDHAWGALPPLAQVSARGAGR